MISSYFYYHFTHEQKVSDNATKKKKRTSSLCYIIVKISRLDKELTKNKNVFTTFRQVKNWMVKTKTKEDKNKKTHTGKRPTKWKKHKNQFHCENLFMTKTFVIHWKIKRYANQKKKHRHSMERKRASEKVVSNWTVRVTLDIKYGC